MNFSQLTLHEDYNLKAINDMFRAGKKRLIRFNNIKLGDVVKHESPPKNTKEKKKQIAQHKKPNNNPRLNLIKKTKQLISNYKEQNYVSSQLSSRSQKNKIKIRYISTSFSNRKPPNLQKFTQNASQYRYPQNNHVFTPQFLSNSLKHNHKNNLMEDPQLDSVHISKHFQRRKQPNKSTIEEITTKIEEEKRPNTTRRRNRPSFQNIQPW